MNTVIQRIAPIINLIAFDLDGTLLNQDHQISKRNHEAIMKLKKKGYKLLITTGRTLPETKEVCDGFPFDGYVCSNGMVNYDKKFSMIHREWIQNNAVLEILSQLRTAKINYELHDEHGDVYIIKEDLSFLKIRIERVKVRPENELLLNIEQGKINIVKFLILTIHNNVVIQDYLQVKKLPVNLIAVSPYNVEINKAGINKWVGVQHHLERLYLSEEKVLAFGDSANDIEILKKSGWSVAMQNAREEVKVEAKDITLSNTEDGVAYYLEKHIL